MDESHDSQDSQNLSRSDMVSEWLGESHFAALIVSDLAECLSLLARKRATLEEKVISRELNALIASYGRILSTVHRLLSIADNPQEEALEKVRTFNYDVRQQVDRLLKALRYNLNYLEQYFEYDFSADLSHTWRFAQAADDLCRQLEK